MLSGCRFSNLTGNMVRDEGGEGARLNGLIF